MSKSMQDQLLSLGLAKKPLSSGQGKSRPDGVVRPAQKAFQKNEKAQKSFQQKKSEKAGDVQADSQKAQSELSLAQAYRLREKQTKDLADQVRQRKLAEDRRRRQLNMDIRDVVMPNRLNDPAAEFARNFVYKGRIRKVNVTAEQLIALNEGKLGLVYVAGGYHLLMPEHVDQVRSLSPEHIPDLTGSTDQDEDDQFPVPDDLIW